MTANSIPTPVPPSGFTGWLRRNRWLLLGVAAAAAVATLLLLRRPVAVVVSPAAREVVDLVVVSGRLRAVREAAVGVEIAGTVEEALVREGDRVAAGQPLVRVGLIDYEAQRMQAAAKRETSVADATAAAVAAEQARSELKRTEKLAARGVTSESELEAARNLAARLTAAESSARARLAEDESSLHLLERQLEKRVVRAPFAGVVTRRSVEPGQSVVPGTTLYLVAEMMQTEIFAETDEVNLGRVKVGQAATVIAPAFRDRPFQARVSQIGPRVDWDRGVVGVRLTPANPPDFVLPNMTVDVNIEVGRFANALTLPVTAVLRDRAGAAALVAVGDRFERRAIRVVGENPTAFAVEGLPVDSRVARDATKVKPGVRYTLVGAK